MNKVDSKIITGKIKHITTPLIADLSSMQIEVIYEFTFSEKAIDAIKALDKQPVIGDIVQVKCNDLKIGEYSINYGLVTDHNALTPITNQRLAL